MTKEETIQVLQSIEDRAVDFPYMTACDWVAIAAAKRHLENLIEVKEVDLEKYYRNFLKEEWFESGRARTISEMMFFTAKHFFELGLKTQKEG